MPLHAPGRFNSQASDKGNSLETRQGPRVHPGQLCAGQRRVPKQRRVHCGGSACRSRGACCTAVGGASTGATSWPRPAGEQHEARRRMLGHKPCADRTGPARLRGGRATSTVGSRARITSLDVPPCRAGTRRRKPPPREPYLGTEQNPKTSEATSKNPKTSEAPRQFQEVRGTEQKSQDLRGPHDTQHRGHSSAVASLLWSSALAQRPTRRWRASWRVCAGVASRPR